MQRKAGSWSRRRVIQGLAGTAGLATLGRNTRAIASPIAGWDDIVVGAGVFGAWSAWQLRRRGRRVLLLDAWGPAHARASSGGESRATRCGYGADEVYSRMAWESLAEWQWLSDRSRLPVFHRTGVLFFFPRPEVYMTATLEVHRKLGLATVALGPEELRKRYPQVDWRGVGAAFFEPALGALMARRGVQELVARFVADGGEYRQALALPPAAANDRLDGIETTSGDRLRAEQFVFACGPWLPKLFPEAIGGRIFPTRQEVFFFAPPAGSTRYLPSQLPTWADFNDGDIYYGFPDLEGRGFKIAHDRHGPPVDPDTENRVATTAGIEDVRSYMRRRFPELAERPLAESRVCQYENSANGDFLIDRHPRWPNAWLVGGGSGHGFKHGPAVGQYVADRVSGGGGPPEPRFSLESKGLVQQREVH